MLIKSLIISAIILVTNNLSISQTEQISSETDYDSLYAVKLGADDYGMKQYVMAFLKSGKVEMEDKTESQKLQLAHLKNIKRMAEEGVLVLAGPFMSNDQGIRGIYIFDVKTVDEAKKLTESDPAFQAGILEMELIPWYGSAALMEVNNIHMKIQKKSITE